jgi:lysophospholipid acyltransferase (LPLAT)-like uncharacterized protein
MPQPIRFSDAPHQARVLDVLLEPLLYLANLAVASCLYPAWRTTRIQWEPDAAELIRLFKERSRPIICFAWHAYELNGICVFRDFPRDLVPLAIGHDGPQSRALQQSAARYGFPIWVYRRRSPIQPKTQLINLLMAERPVIGLFPDSGGPDGQVRLGFLEVARAAGALLVPMAWHARPVLVVRSPPRRYCLPVPFSRILACYGQPIDGVHATADDCRCALEVLERRSSAAASEAERSGLFQ